MEEKEIHELIQKGQDEQKEKTANQFVKIVTLCINENLEKDLRTFIKDKYLGLYELIIDHYQNEIRSNRRRNQTV